MLLYTNFILRLTNIYLFKNILNVVKVMISLYSVFVTLDVILLLAIYNKQAVYELYFVFIKIKV